MNEDDKHGTDWHPKQPTHTPADVFTPARTLAPAPAAEKEGEKEEEHGKESLGEA